MIQVGQVLTIRGGSSNGYSSGGSTITYTVVSGDTLSGIAERYGTTVAELQRLNNISNPNLIQVGQVLTIQGSAYGESTYNPSDNLPLNEEGFFVTENDLRKIGWTNVSSSMVLDLNSCLRRFQINTVNRIRHFISQCSHESGGGVYTREIASGEAYNGRSDLGNIYPGDGPKFKGGGYIQLTGRYNYQQFANYMGDQQIVQQGVNYMASRYPWTSAGFWWYRNGMNALCDAGASVEAITLKVNGGYNGLADRKYWYNRCVQVITSDSIESNNPSTNNGTSTSGRKSSDESKFIDWVKNAEKACEKHFQNIFSPLYAYKYVIGRSILEQLRKPEYWENSYVGMWKLYTPEVGIQIDENYASALCRATVSKEPTIKNKISSLDIAHMSATVLGYVHWGISRDKGDYSLGDLGGWTLDLLQIWGNYSREAKNKNLEEWLKQNLGSKSDGKGFGYDDILADADAYLIANKGVIDLSVTISNLYQYSKSERIKMFYKERFDSSKSNVINAFTKLADGIDFGPIDNFNTEKLLNAAKADSLPTKEDAEVLAKVFADFIENPSR